MKCKAIGKHIVGFEFQDGVNVLKIARVDKQWPEDWFCDLAAGIFGVTGTTPAFGINGLGYNIVSYYW